MQHTNRSIFPLPLYSDTSNLPWYSLTRSIIFWYVSFCRVFVGIFPVSIIFPESTAHAWLPLIAFFGISMSCGFSSKFFHLTEITTKNKIFSTCWIHDWLYYYFELFLQPLENLLNQFQPSSWCGPKTISKEGFQNIHSKHWK